MLSSAGLLVCGASFLASTGNSWQLTGKGYKEISRAHLLEPTNMMVAGQRPKDHPAVLWSHPAFAHRSIYARNDKEIIRVSLAAGNGKAE